MKAERRTELAYLKKQSSEPRLVGIIADMKHSSCRILRGRSALQSNTVSSDSTMNNKGEDVGLEQLLEHGDT